MKKWEVKTKIVSKYSNEKQTENRLVAKVSLSFSLEANAAFDLFIFLQNFAQNFMFRNMNSSLLPTLVTITVWTGRRQDFLYNRRMLLCIYSAVHQQCMDRLYNTCILYMYERRIYTLKYIRKVLQINLTWKGIIIYGAKYVRSAL
jgi:hypothetical protein